MFGSLQPPDITLDLRRQWPDATRTKILKYYYWLSHQQPWMLETAMAECFQELSRPCEDCIRNLVMTWYMSFRWESRPNGLEVKDRWRKKNGCPCLIMFKDGCPICEALGFQGWMHVYLDMIIDDHRCISDQTLQKRASKLECEAV